MIGHISIAKLPHVSKLNVGEKLEYVNFCFYIPQSFFTPIQVQQYLFYKLSVGCQLHYDFGRWDKMPKLKHVFSYLFKTSYPNELLFIISEREEQFIYVYVHNMHAYINKKYLYVHTCTHTYIYIYVCVCVCVCVCMYLLKP